MRVNSFVHLFFFMKYCFILCFAIAWCTTSAQTDSLYQKVYSLANQRISEFLIYFKSPPVYLNQEVLRSDCLFNKVKDKTFLLKYFSAHEINALDKQNSWSGGSKWNDSLLLPGKVFVESDQEINAVRNNSTDVIVEIKCSQPYFTNDGMYAAIYFYWTDAEYFAEGRVYVYMRMDNGLYKPVDSMLIGLK